MEPLATLDAHAVAGAHRRGVRAVRDNDRFVLSPMTPMPSDLYAGEGGSQGFKMASNSIVPLGLVLGPFAGGVLITNLTLPVTIHRAHGAAGSSWRAVPCVYRRPQETVVAPCTLNVK
jgi:hypothetical protein